MLAKVLLLVAVVALTWWWTRPWTTRRINRGKKSETLIQCPHCGVYNAPNIPCKCQQQSPPPD